MLKQAPPVLLQRHVLCIQQAGAEAIYGMFFAVGLVARAVIFSQSRIKKLGITGEIYSGIITLGYLAGVLFGFRNGAWAPVKMSIMEGNVEVQRGTFAFLFASTLDRLLFGMRPYWGQEQEPLHVTFVRQQRKHPLRSLLQLLSGKGDVLKEKNGYHSHNTQVLELLVDDVYVVDGESYRCIWRRWAASYHGSRSDQFSGTVGRKGETITMAESALAVDQHIPDALEAEMASLSSKTVSPDFLVFVEALKARFESSLDAVLLYGSCLRRL